MSLALLLLCAVGLSSALPCTDEITPREGEKCGYESCTQAKKGVLNVHLVPHSHDDVGWLKTVDQYYYGSRNDIQNAGVQYILNSVVKELWEDPKRRFIYVETAFFWKWWESQGKEVRSKVHTLVRQGRLQFVGGAWSMNDEATTHYQCTIDQFTLGLRKLNDTFGYCGMPRVGWQIDPFGHSKEFASLLANMGYDGLFLGRIDYQDKAARLRKKRMEMIWRPDDVLGQKAEIFTGVLYNTYSAPDGFCFDILCDDAPIVDDMSSPLYNVDSKIAQFLAYVQKQAKFYQTNNILVTMGDDFNYQDATTWYTNLDKLIKYANMKAEKDCLNINVFYSTPDCYLKAVKDANPTLPTKEDDFFPYASDQNSYWTGFYTSRPTLKYYERQVNNNLQMFKQVQVLAGLPQENDIVLEELKSALGVLQHHDAVTGTEKQHVADDYARILYKANDDATAVARQALSKLIEGDLNEQLFSYGRCKINESSCPIAEQSTQFVATIYNPLGWAITEPVRIPVTEGTYEVYDSNGDKVESQLQYISEGVRNIPNRASKATRKVLFIADLDALGTTSYFIRKCGPSDATVLLNYEDEGECVLDNEMIRLPVDRKSGTITQIITPDRTIDIKTQFYYWTAFQGDNKNPSQRSSGAYIFRPQTTTPVPIPYNNKFKIDRGTVSDEVWLETDKNVHSIFRLYRGIPYMEHDFVVGPIDVADGVGKEYIVRYETNLNNNGVFYPDANARQLQEHKLNKRPQWNLTLIEPVAGNYCPVSNAIVIAEDKDALCVITDRAQGGTSLANGEIELMVHRRLLRDDGFGVGEALNERVNGNGLVHRATHRIMTGDLTNDDDIVKVRKQMLQMSLRPLLFVSSADHVTFEEWKKLNNRFVGMKPLPPAVHLLTLERWNTKEILIRFENIHRTATQKFKLSTLFNTFKIKYVRETTLAANRWLKDTKKWTWKTDKKLYVNSKKEAKNDGLKTIILKPKEIRTFVVEFEYIEP